MRTAFIRTLEELAGDDPRIYLLTGDVGYSVFERFAAAYPERYVNVGVAEQAMAGVAAGLAACGKVPFIYSIANFPTLRCLEQLRVDVCYHRANVKVVAVGGGLAYGPQGPTHHGTEDLAILRALPNLAVVAPGDPWEAALATRAAAVRPGPVYLRLGKAGEPQVHASLPDFAIGRASLVRDGRDVTIVATGGVLHGAALAAAELAREGIAARLLSMHTVKPLDEAAVLAAARETGGIVTVEEHNVVGGLGGAVAEVLAESGLGVRFRRLGLPDTFAEVVGSQAYLQARYGLGPAGIAAAARALLG